MGIAHNTPRPFPILVSASGLFFSFPSLLHYTAAAVSNAKATNTSKGVLFPVGEDESQILIRTMVQHRNVACVLVAVAAGMIIQSDAFSPEEINEGNCLERLLESDEDGSGFLEQAELQRFVDSTASLQPCQILAGSSLASAEEFCRLLWLRCPNDGSTPEPVEVAVLTAPPQTMAPTSVLVDEENEENNDTSEESSSTTNDAEQEPVSTSTPPPFEEEIDVSPPLNVDEENDETSEESTSATNEAEQEPVSTSTLPPFEEEIDVSPPLNHEEDCSFVGCHRWFLVGAPVLLGLIAGLCLGLIYVEGCGGWHEEKPELLEHTTEDHDSTAAVEVLTYNSTKQIVDSDKHDQDIEAGNFGNSEALSFVRTLSLRSRSDILETLPEGAFESDSEFMSDLVSHSTMGDSDTAGFSHMSDTTPLHHNKRPALPVDLDDAISTTTSSSISSTENQDSEPDTVQELTKDKANKPTKFTTTERVIATLTQKTQHGTGDKQAKQTYTQPVVVNKTTSSAMSAPLTTRTLSISPSRRSSTSTSAVNPTESKQRRSELSKSNSWHADKRAFPVTEVSTRRNSNIEDDKLDQRRTRSFILPSRSNSVGRGRAVSLTNTRRARSAIHLATTQPKPVVLVSEDLKIAVRGLPVKQKSWRTFQSEELSL